MKTFFGSMYEISSYMKTFFGSMYEISSYMKTFFGSMYGISSYMKTFFGSMYEISSCYDRDFLIHEIFISWRFHDPYLLCLKILNVSQSLSFATNLWRKNPWMRNSNTPYQWDRSTHVVTGILFHKVDKKGTFVCSRCCTSDS